jgi:hypothetical protein
MAFTPVNPPKARPAVANPLVFKKFLREIMFLVILVYNTVLIFSSDVFCPMIFTGRQQK